MLKETAQILEPAIEPTGNMSIIKKLKKKSPHNQDLQRSYRGKLNILKYQGNQNSCLTISQNHHL